MPFHQIVAILTVVQSFLVGIFLLRYFNNMLKVVFGFVSFAVCTEITNSITIYVFGRTTLWLAHFYVMFEFLFWAIFYWYLLKPMVKSSILWTLVVSFELFCLINMFLIQSLNEYPITRAIEGIILVGFSITYFYKLMTEGKIQKLIREPSVWINSALLIYLGGSVFHYLLFNFLLNVNVEFLRMVNIYFFISLNLIFYLVISVSFYLQKLKTQRGKA